MSSKRNYFFWERGERLDGEGERKEQLKPAANASRLFLWRFIGLL